MPALLTVRAYDQETGEEIPGVLVTVVYDREFCPATVSTCYGGIVSPGSWCPEPLVSHPFYGCEACEVMCTPPGSAGCHDCQEVGCCDAALSPDPLESYSVLTPGEITLPSFSETGNMLHQLHVESATKEGYESFVVLPSEGMNNPAFPGFFWVYDYEEIFLGAEADSPPGARRIGLLTLAKTMPECPECPECPAPPECGTSICCILLLIACILLITYIAKKRKS